ncbi:MAG TPA: 8-oxo-dGTP diphosphatase MutT [Gammaproteobacteria bacterium]|nr:8-oxo-dGTP diphosphatase MutT [Gammaproteobacteria bacterium]
MSVIIPVAVGIVLNSESKVLVSLRPQNKDQGGLWEFPGGKIERGENPEQALKRELLEEVGIVVQRARPLMQFEYDYTSRFVMIDVWQVEEFSGEAHGREGQEIAWIELMQLGALNMLSANRPILEWLRGKSSSSSLSS